jgi:polyvinyl alcohol dehydrogenase (cytochrome)
MDEKRGLALRAALRTKLGTGIAVAVVVVVVAAILLTSMGVFGLPGGARGSTTSTATTVSSTPTATPNPSPTPGPTILPATGGAWTMYLGDDGHSGYNPSEGTIRPTRLWTLHHMWVSPNYGPLTSQIIAANNLDYFGSWSGYERAIRPDDPNPVWQTYLGITHASCRPYTLGADPGVASTATAVTVNGAPTLYVGGGDAQLYALNALTGAVKWHTRLGSSPDHFIWGSPVIYKGSIYIGLASTADCPVVGGQLFKLDALTGAIQQQFSTVPQGCTGGEVWDAAALDDTMGVVYITTGRAGTCSQPEPYADAIVALHAADLSVVGSWQVPASQQIANGGFRAAPTFFQANLSDGAHTMLGVGNKNGIFYAFDRTQLSSGPVWQQRVADPGGCVNYLCNAGVVVAAAWDGHQLYVGGGATTVKGNSCPGSVAALVPETGKQVWQGCYVDGHVMGVTLVGQGGNELVIICAGYSMVIVAAPNGAQHYIYEDPEFMNFFAPADASNAVTSWPNVDGGIHQMGARN